ncbi:MAG: Trk system potassium transporter TrkA [Verrucomicrobiales bacterium]|nr:Trk system potassium transporter TrkA [Verrucomicrobiales bacterium]
MNIIIVGAGEIGTHIALSLASESHSIVVIEANEKVATELNNRIDARVMVADGTSISVLIEAGVSDCDLFLSLTSDNNINLVSSSVARQLGAAKSICRVHPGIQRESLFLDYGEHFGIDYLFSPERLASIELAKYVRNPKSAMVEEIARGYVEIQQVQVNDDSKLCGKALIDIDFPSRIRVGAITRGKETIVPSASEILMTDDLVTLFGEPAKLHDTVLQFRNKSGKDAKSNIVIFGGGEYGFSLAQSLESWNCRVRIFEQNPERCRELSDLLTNVTIINADATSIAEMKEERIGEADFFIAVTGVDEDNVMTCLQAHSLGTKYCLPLIHRADYADAMTGFGEKMGILAAVSPREATRKDLARFITSDRFHLLQTLEGVELIEATVHDDSSIIGKSVREIKWPADCVLVAQLHGVRGEVPTAEDIINAGDSLYALVKPRAKREFLKLVAP